MLWALNFLLLALTASAADAASDATADTSATSSNRPKGIIADPKTFSSQSFDYLVVGGGTAGLVVASRLSEESGVTVGVIEAGVQCINDAKLDVPLNVGQPLFDRAYDWSFQTANQTGLNGRAIPSSRGKVLGGSSQLNAMIFGRASGTEYDQWEALGNAGWNWANLLTYFKKSETVAPGQAILPGSRALPGASPSAGKTGPLQISFVTNSTFPSGLLAPWSNSLFALGSKANADPHNGNNVGTFLTPRSVGAAGDTKGKRSSATDYLEDRRNLLILTGAQVTKVDFKSTKLPLVAKGVTFKSSSGQDFSATANKEVILAAGGFKSPQLLELSGIGNKDILSKFGINTLINNANVGENLQDHPFVAQDFLLKNPAPPTLDLLRLDPAFAAAQATQYATKKDGAFATTNAGVSFQPIQDFADSKTLTDILNTAKKESTASNLNAFTKAQLGISNTLLKAGKVGQIETVLTAVVSATAPPLDGRSYLSMSTFVARPFSRGSTHIQSSDPLADPLIDPKYFSSAVDVKTMVLAMKTARKLTQTEPLKSLIDRPSTPPPEVVSDADFEKAARNSATTSWHACGGAALAPKKSGGVVDPNLIVYDTTNLRVVDASVIPLLMAAHNQATVYAIAEKAADLIKKDCKN